VESPAGFDAFAVATVESPAGLDAFTVATVESPAGLDAFTVTTVESPAGLDAFTVATVGSTAGLDAFAVATVGSTVRFDVFTVATAERIGSRGGRCGRPPRGVRLRRSGSGELAVRCGPPLLATQAVLGRASFGGHFTSYSESC
jgi:hypothetical protein